MSEIKKAGSYFKYIMALVIASLFGIFGKVAPNWATEAKHQYNTKVFQHEFYGEKQTLNTGKLYAQTSTVTTTSTSTSTNTIPEGPDDLINIIEPQPIIAILAFTSEDAARAQERLNEQYNTLISKIYTKVYEGESLSSDEVTLLSVNELIQEVNRLKSQVEKLSSDSSTTTSVTR